MKLVLIGGGETGRGNEQYSTKEIDEEVVRLTNKNNPTFVFVGFASNSSESYFDTMKKIYTPLGCTCQNLKRKNLVKNYDLAVEKIRNADIIYFCGGDTIKLIEEIKEFKLEKELYDAIERDCVIAGISAGAILMSKEGYSDSLKLRGESDSYTFIEGINVFKESICPHYDSEEKKKCIKEDILNKNIKVYGLENDTALVITEKDINVIKSDKDKNAFVCYYKDGEYIEEVIN